MAGASPTCTVVRTCRLLCRGPYLAEDPYGQVEPYGYYAESQKYGWGEPDVYGQLDPMGYYAEDPYLAEETYMARPIPTATTPNPQKCMAGVSRTCMASPTPWATMPRSLSS